MTASALFLLAAVQLVVILLLVIHILDRAQEVRLMFTGAVIDGVQIKGYWRELMDLRLTQQVTATVRPIDRRGNPAKVEEGSVEWSSSDEAVATVTQDASDPLKALIVAVGEGGCQIVVKADSDLGDGVHEITGIGTIGVLPDDAVGFTNLAFSDVVEQPDSLQPNQ